MVDCSSHAGIAGIAGIDRSMLGRERSIADGAIGIDGIDSTVVGVIATDGTANPISSVAAGFDAGTTAT